MKPGELSKIVVAMCLPILLGTPFIFMGVEPLQEITNKLKLPVFAPPTWVFPLTWAYIYAGLGIALWLIWEMPRSVARNRALVVYLVQLLLNLAFNLLLYAWNKTGLAFFVLVVAWFGIVILLKLFYKQRPVAAYLIIPYFIWRTYSIFLAYFTWQLNS